MQNGIQFMRLSKISIRRISDIVLLEVRDECNEEISRRQDGEKANRPFAA